MTDIGSVLSDRYRLIELLGQGGMATIYRAHDSRLDRDVAVKVLRPEYGRDPEFGFRFRQEAQAAASLNHPNIVAVHDFGQDTIGPFIVMELVDGEDLATTIRRDGPMRPRQAARIVADVARALNAAHARGIVHRDVKPGNIMLTRDGRPKVTDFGIARAVAEAQMTLPGTTLGSVHYFSPEQVRGQPAIAASDTYSLGIVLYELLVGRRPWEGDSAASIAVARLSGSPPAPSDVRSDVPPGLDAIVRKALALEADQRFASGSAMADALDTFLRRPGAADASQPGAADASRPGVGHSSRPGAAVAGQQPAADAGRPSAADAGRPEIAAVAAAREGADGGRDIDPGDDREEDERAVARAPFGVAGSLGAGIVAQGVDAALVAAAGAAAGGAAAVGAASLASAAASGEQERPFGIAGEAAVGSAAAGGVGVPGQSGGTGGSIADVPPRTAGPRTIGSAVARTSAARRYPDDLYASPQARPVGVAATAGAGGPVGRPAEGRRLAERPADEEPRSVYPWLAGLLALVVLAAVGFVAFQIFNSGGNPPAGQVRVPNLIGRTLAQAQADAALSGLTVRQGSSSPDPQNVDRVVSQSPDPNTSVNRSSEIVVTIGTVPAQVVVPDITHHTPADASAILSAVNLTLGNQTGARYDPSIPAGQIVESFPPAGLPVNPGRSVDYTLSQGPEPTPTPSPTPVPTPTPTPVPTAPPPTPVLVTVNDYTCMSYDEARQRLAHDGLQAGTIVTEPPGQELQLDGSWRVVAQDPTAGGDPVPFGTHVNLTLEDPATAPC